MSAESGSCLKRARVTSPDSKNTEEVHDFGDAPVGLARLSLDVDFCTLSGNHLYTFSDEDVTVKHHLMGYTNRDIMFDFERWLRSQAYILFIQKLEFLRSRFPIASVHDCKKRSLLLYESRVASRSNDLREYTFGLELQIPDPLKTRSAAVRLVCYRVFDSPECDDDDDDADGSLFSDFEENSIVASTEAEEVDSRLVPGEGSKSIILCFGDSSGIDAEDEVTRFVGKPDSQIQVSRILGIVKNFQDTIKDIKVEVERSFPQLETILSVRRGLPGLKYVHDSNTVKPFQSILEWIQESCGEASRQSGVVRVTWVVVAGTGGYCREEDPEEETLDEDESIDFIEDLEEEGMDDDEYT